MVIRMIIYKITNKINGKVYIGQTIKPLSVRWKQHCNKRGGCSALHNAIIKYGAINFIVEQIDCAFSREELDQKEIYWIKYYNSLSPNGYNLTSGGHHPVISYDVKKRLSEVNKGKRPSDKCILSSVNSRKGKKLSKEHIEKLRQTRIGNKNGMFGVHRFDANNPNSKKVYCIELDRIFLTINNACDFIKKDRSTLHLCLQGKLKTAGGYHWRYADEK